MLRNDRHQTLASRQERSKDIELIKKCLLETCTNFSKILEIRDSAQNNGTVFIANKSIDNVSELHNTGTLHNQTYGLKTGVG